MATGLDWQCHSTIVIFAVTLLHSCTGGVKNDIHATLQTFQPDLPMTTMVAPQVVPQPHLVVKDTDPRIFFIPPIINMDQPGVGGQNPPATVLDNLAGLIPPIVNAGIIFVVAAFAFIPIIIIVGVLIALAVGLGGGAAGFGDDGDFFNTRYDNFRPSPMFGKWGPSYEPHGNKYTTYTSYRSLNNPYSLGFVDVVSMLEETWRRFDASNVECQQRLLCELHQHRNEFCSSGRTVIRMFRFLDTLEKLRLPQLVKRKIAEYQEARAIGTSQQNRVGTQETDCAKAYSSCQFSLIDIIKRYSTPPPTDFQQKNSHNNPHVHKLFRNGTMWD